MFTCSHTHTQKLNRHTAQRGPQDLRYAPTHTPEKWDPWILPQPGTLTHRYLPCPERDAQTAGAPYQRVSQMCPSHFTHSGSEDQPPGRRNHLAKYRSRQAAYALWVETVSVKDCYLL